MRIHSIHTYALGLLFILGIGAFPGCTVDTYEELPDTGEARVQFEVLLPADARGTSQTRGMSTAQEAVIQTIDVYHFLKRTGASTDDYANYLAVRSEPVQGTFISGVPSWISATLNTFPGRDSRLVFVLNARKSGNYGYAKNMTLEDFTNALIVEQTAEWNSAAASPTPLPIYGITGNVNIHKDIPNGELDDNGDAFPLFRMHAKFNISQKAVLDEGTFRLASVCMFNRKTQGFIAYDESKMNMSVPKATAPHIPSTTGTVYLNGTSFGVGTDNSASDYGKIVNKLYVFEANNANESDRLKKTALVIGGYYDTDTKVSYYRVDVDVTNGNILRNHLYDVEIKSVAARGYETEEEAFIGGNQMTAVVTPWNLAGQSVVGDAQYRLTVSEDEGYFLRPGGEMTVTAVTDYDIAGQGFSPGIYITKSSSTSWLTIEDVTGTEGSANREFKIVVESVGTWSSAGIRTGEVYVKAGNLTKVIPITHDYTEASRFARSNVVYCNGILTFAETAEANLKPTTVTTVDGTPVIRPAMPANAAGVFFKWSSLLAVSDGQFGKTFTASQDIIFNPSQKSPTSWDEIPCLSGHTTSIADVFIEDYPSLGYDEAEGLGDICRYISDKRWVEGRWRMPTTSEIQRVYLETDGSARSVSYGNGVAPTITGDGIEHGLFPVSNGLLMGNGVVAADISAPDNMVAPGERRVFFPAFGSRNTLGNLITSTITTSYGTASVASDAQSKWMKVYAASASSNYSASKLNGMTVRCILDN